MEVQVFFNSRILVVVEFISDFCNTATLRNENSRLFKIRLVDFFSYPGVRRLPQKLQKLQSKASFVFLFKCNLKLVVCSLSVYLKYWLSLELTNQSCNLPVQIFECQASNPLRFFGKSGGHWVSRLYPEIRSLLKLFFDS